MDPRPELVHLADTYRSRRLAGASEVSPGDALLRLADQSARRREDSLLKIVAEALAVGPDAVEPGHPVPSSTQALEALRRAGPSSDGEDKLDAASLPPETLAHWRAALFELLLAERLNAGGSVGDLQLGPGERVDWSGTSSSDACDLRVATVTESGNEDLQQRLDATVAPVKRALSRFTDLEVVAGATGATRIAQILDVTGDEKDWGNRLIGTLEELMDNPIHSLATYALPGLPFVVITIGEGHRVLAGRSSVLEALSSAARRSAGPGIPLAVGGLFLLLGAGLWSLPAAVFSRMGISRLERLQRLSETLEWESNRLRSMLRSLAVRPAFPALPERSDGAPPTSADVPT